MLATPHEGVASNALDRVGVALRDQGLSGEELIASGRKLRGDLLRQHLGIDPDRPADG